LTWAFKKPNISADGALRSILEALFRITAFSRKSAAGMGVVYNPGTFVGPVCCLEVLTRGLASNGQVLERFRREAKAASALNIQYLHIYDIGEQSGKAFIVMEFLEGLTLNHHIAGRPMDLAPFSPSGSRLPTLSMSPMQLDHPS